MLTELRIRNFAVIEEAALAFGPGLNVLSGETGAGKTIIMTALGLLTGGRASPDLIRSGTKEAVVEGIFAFEGEGAAPGAAEWIDPDNPRELIVRRVIAEGGRSRVTINDHLATVQALARLGVGLVQIYGQHDQQMLLQRDHHLAILDRHAGLETALVDYRDHYEQVRELHARLAEIEQRTRDKADLLEVLRFRVNELERAELVSGEDAKLAAERVLLANAARLTAAAEAVEQTLYTGDGAALDTVAKAETRLTEAATIDPLLTEPLELLTAARTNLEEAAHALRDYAARLEADPARLDQLETRANELARLKRKYGGTLDEALETLARSREELSALEALDENRTAAESALQGALATLASAARDLNVVRLQSGAELVRRMNAELKTLGMRGAIFELRYAPTSSAEGGFTFDGVALGPSGADTVEFFLSANPGQPALPLTRIASGGELSRIMLALKRVEAQRRGVATLIFDEVDAGIGGAVAEIVGRKLKETARFHQILCVTHLAQIAAFGDSHFFVEKEERRGITRSRVATLEPGGRPSELARMLGGDETNDKFLRAARELIDRAASDLVRV